MRKTTEHTRTTVVAMSLLLVLPLVAAAGPGSGMPRPVPTDGEAYLPDADADQLYTYITTLNPYWKWAPFPGPIDDPFEFPIQANEEPHGEWVSVFINNPANESLFDPLTPFSMRYGSILVKENYPASAGPPPADRSTLLSLTVMYKVRGFRSIPTEDEWFWAMYSPTGRTLQLSEQQGFIANGSFASFQGEVQAGKPWFCLHCHRGARETSSAAVGDYVWKLEPFRGPKGE